MTEAVGGPPRTSCAVRQPPRNRTSRPCFCAAVSLLQRMRLPTFFALYSPFFTLPAAFFSLLFSFTLLRFSSRISPRRSPGPRRAKKSAGEERIQPGKTPVLKQVWESCAAPASKIEAGVFYAEKRKALLLENQFTRFFCMRSRMRIATKFMAKTSATSSSPVLYCIGRVFSISVPAVASTYMW